MSMGQRSEALASKFEAAVSEFADTIKALPETKWGAVCNAEGWTVAQTAEHVAGQFPLEMEYIVAAAEGKPLPGYSWDDINGKNDSRAGKASGVSKDTVLKVLSDGAKSTAAYIRGLDDEQLDRKAALALAGGAEVSAEQLIMGGVLIEHVTGHLQSIRSA
jgi:hypothetical protein